MGAMLMNMAANMLGLGNAATPLGLRAMRDISNGSIPRPGAPSNAMCTFLAINTGSIQLDPGDHSRDLLVRRFGAPFGDHRDGASGDDLLDGGRDRLGQAPGKTAGLSIAPVRGAPPTQRTEAKAREADEPEAFVEPRALLASSGRLILAGIHPFFRGASRADYDLPEALIRPHRVPAKRGSRSRR